MSVRPPSARRRAGAALAAAGLLALVGAAPAEPPALAAPGAAGDSYGDPSPDPHTIPGLAAPSGAFGSGFPARGEPAPLRTEPAAPDESAAAAPDDDREPRGWLSFSPRRVRPASGSGGASFYEEGYTLAPQPDPISAPRLAYAPRATYRPQGLEDARPAPAPAPLPIPEAWGDDGSFDPVPAAPPRRSRPEPPPARPTIPPPAPPAAGRGPAMAALPPDTLIHRGWAVRDLRSPPPPPPTGVPFADPHGGLYGGGYGAGPIGAGPIGALGAAGGMCALGDCHGAVPLFRRLEIEDPDHVHPYAVRQVVAVADPSRPAPPIGLAKLFHRKCTGCARGCVECDPLCDAGDSLVFVEVCVPPCRPEEVKVTRHGHRVHMDFGKYEVTLTSRDGYVKVDYDD